MRLCFSSQSLLKYRRKLVLINLTSLEVLGNMNLVQMSKINFAEEGGGASLINDFYSG